MTRAWITKLRCLGACDEAVTWAAAYSTLEEAWSACERGEWMLWLINRLEAWSTDTLTEYCRVTAPAWDECERVTASAQAERKNVSDAAWAEYERVMAAAWAEYERVRLQAIRRLVPVPPSLSRRAR